MIINHIRFWHLLPEFVWAFSCLLTITQWDVQREREKRKDLLMKITIAPRNSVLATKIVSVVNDCCTHG